MANTHTPDSQKGRGKDANRDPITKTPGAHPIGTGIGATAGGIAGAAAAGAAAGTVVGGPVGTAAGLVVGAVAGGLAGKAVAEKIDPTVEDAYWREAYRKESYYSSDYNYDDYGPAYQVGYSAYSRNPDKSFDEIESDLESDYSQQRGKSRLSWDRAKDASRAAWNRAKNSIGDNENRH